MRGVPDLAAAAEREAIVAAEGAVRSGGGGGGAAGAEEEEEAAGARARARERGGGVSKILLLTDADAGAMERLRSELGPVVRGRAGLTQALSWAIEVCFQMSGVVL